MSTKGFRKHECASPDCDCYQCSVCDRKLVLCRKLRHHQQFSECRHLLTPEQRERECTVKRKKKLLHHCGGDEDPGQEGGLEASQEVGGQGVVEQPPSDPPSRLMGVTYSFKDRHTDITQHTYHNTQP